MRLATVPIVLSCCLLVASCASSSDTGAVDSTTTTVAVTPSSSNPSSTIVATTTTIAATTTTMPAYSVVSDVVYMTVDGTELKLDVYVPAAADGPTPTVVTFHGQSPTQKSDVQTASVAQEAATQGMVVFVPSWFHVSPIPLDPLKLQTMAGIANCAVAFAQQNAAQYGGDPNLTVVDGFSAGVFPAISASLNQVSEPVDGCVASEPPTPVLGTVLGDGEYFLHHPQHDAAFDADLTGMQAAVANWITAANWPEAIDTQFYLWIAADGTNPRSLRSIDDESGWFASRDADGSIRADLDRLDQLEDGILSYVDTGQLLHLRMAKAGFAVSLDEYPGGHITTDKLAEIVGYFADATNG